MLESAIIFIGFFLFTFLILYIKRQNDIESNFDKIIQSLEKKELDIQELYSHIARKKVTDNDLEKIESVSYTIWENDDYSLVYDKDKSFYWNYLVLVNLVNSLRKKVK